MNERNRRVLNSLVAILGIRGIDLLVGLLLVPLSLSYLGQLKYGIWLVIFSIPLWFNYFDGGLGHGLRNRLAEALALNRYDSAKRYVSTTYVIVITISILLVALSVLLSTFLNWNEIINSEELSSKDTTILALIVFSTFSIGFSTRLVHSILLASQKPAISQFLNLANKITILIGLLLLIKFSTKSIIAYSVVYTIPPLLLSIAATGIIFKRYLKPISPSIKSFDIDILPNLLRLSFQFFIIQISVAILFSTDNIIITQLYGPQEVTPYQIAGKYFGIPILLFGMILTPMWSAFTEAYTQNDMIWIKKILNILLVIWICLAVFTLLMLTSSPYIYRYWLGSTVSIPIQVSVGWAVFTILQTLNMVLTNLLNGINETRIQMYLAIVSIFINIPLSILFAKPLGMGSSGVIFATSFSILIYVLFKFIKVKKVVYKSQENTI